VFRRNWDRVVGSIGRSDHTTYTAPFVTEVDRLATDAATCPGAEHLRTLRASSAEINAAAENNEPDFAAINTFVDAGNDWLETLGYGSGLLATS
jgi:hypothetical protein